MAFGAAQCHAIGILSARRALRVQSRTPRAGPILAAAMAPFVGPILAAAMASLQLCQRNRFGVLSRKPVLIVANVARERDLGIWENCDTSGIEASKGGGRMWTL